MRGIDVSNNNKRVNLDGVEFMFIKQTEGVGFDDWTAPYWRGEADKARIPWGCYHFAHPDQHSPQQEAQYFVDKGVRGRLAPALDFETRTVNGKTIDPLALLGAAACRRWIDQWCQFVQGTWGQVPFVYMNRYYAQQLLPMRWPLWLATATGVPGMYKQYLGVDVVIEQWGIVNGVDENESYLPIIDPPAPAPPTDPSNPSPRKKETMFSYLLDDGNWFMVASGKHLYLDDVARIGVMAGGIPHLGKMTQHFFDTCNAAFGSPVGSP